MRTATFVGLLAAVVGVAELDGQGRGSSQGGAKPAGADPVKAFIASRAEKGFTPPKTPWGAPDIQGVFTTKDEANTPFERPAEWAGRAMDDISPQEFAEAVAKRQQEAIEFAPFFGGGEPQSGVAIAVPIHWFDNLAAKNSRPWFVIDPVEGKIPALTTDAQARAIAARGPGLRGGGADSYIDRGLGDRCIVSVTGAIWQLPTIYGNSFQIVQARHQIVMRYEMIHEARVIPLDGRPHLGPTVRPYYGDSRGRWDGNTLVVETTNFPSNLLFYLIGAGPTRHSAANLKVIERFTRIAPNKVEWTLTMDDSTQWVRPWTYSLPLTEDNTQVIHEYACHEGNYGMANILSAARSADRKKQP